MRWNNCSKEEARDAYDSAKSRLQNAADQYIHNKYTMDTLAGERSSAQTKQGIMRTVRRSILKKGSRI